MTMHCSTAKLLKTYFVCFIKLMKKRLSTIIGRLELMLDVSVAFSTFLLIVFESIISMVLCL